MRIATFVCILLSGVFTANLMAFDHLTVDDGLSQGTITAILQDRQGFMWFGTSDGLNRYDGYSFTIYRNIQGNPGSLPYSIVSALYEDREGTLWVGTAGGGLARFDSDTETFTSFPLVPEKDVSSGGMLIGTICEDSRGNLWISAGNRLSTIIQFLPRTGEWFQYPLTDKDTGHALERLRIFSDDRGQVWVLADTQVLRWDSKDKSFHQVPMESVDPSPLVPYFMCETDKGLVCLTSQGVFVPGEASDHFEYLEPFSIDPAPNWQERLTAGLMTRDRSVWFALRDGGLYRFSAQTGELDHFSPDPNDPGSLSDNPIYRLYMDASGILWIGTETMGLDIYDATRTKFSRIQKNPTETETLTSNMVWSVTQDLDGKLWVGTQRGLNEIDRNSGSIRHYFYTEKEDSMNPPNDTIQSLYCDKEGTIWAGAARMGLHRKRASDKDFQPFSFNIPRISQLNARGVIAIHQDSHGSMWFGTAGYGLIRWDPEKNTFTNFTIGLGPGGGLPGDAVRDIMEDSKGTLWIAARGGVCRYMRKENGFDCWTHDPGNPYGLNHPYTQCLEEDKEGKIWVGTLGGGLNGLDPTTGRFTHIMERDGLPNNVIYGILRDGEGHLWLSTNAGIARFTPETGMIKRFGVEDGLQSMEFNAGASFRNDSGDMFFGGVRGLNVFSPDILSENPHPPKVTITGFRLFNKPVTVGEHSPLRQAICVTEVIDLPYNQNSMSFEYVGLHFSAPQKNQYAYRLEGLEDDWTMAGNRRIAIYTNIPPGSYTFHVRAASSDGIWNDEGAQLRIRIHPPWWKTWWAYLFYLFGAVGLVLTIVRVEKAREREKARLTEAELRARAAELQSRVAEAQSRALQNEIDLKNQELEEARRFQLSMLPVRPPSIPGLEIAAFMQTASEVGGDYYDFHVCEDGSLTVAIGDATGHGTRSGIMVAIMKGLFSTLRGKTNLLEFMQQTNILLKTMRLENMWMALTLLRYKDGNVNLTSAGMPPVLIYKAAKETVTELLVEGMLLGVDFPVPHRDENFHLDPGDTILLMTDGFAELYSDEEEILDYPRAIRIFEEVADQSPGQIIEHLVNAGDEWRKERHQEDDITFVVLKIT
ncbi:MAG TPA: two-component regulator propeller domain-containing protein [Thermoanaerobaculia bacterium]|nr:two-component regulator propeller domain-containing protein [Thermoanaerobaculia bacterium]HXK66963.1 two-component regulator propeller domain-containing protein [Thermoanaerobaculia bacterium]